MSEPIQIKEISGGVRRLPPRAFPPNALKKAENIIASVNDSIFETAPPISDLLNIGSGNVIVDAISHYYEEERIFYVYIETGTGTFIVKAFGDTPITIGDVGIPDDARFAVFNSEVLIHKWLAAGGSGSTRSIYKEWTYTRGGTETTETALFDLPTAIDPIVQFAINIPNTVNDLPTNDIPSIIEGVPSGYFQYIAGYQINGFESIIDADPDQYSRAVAESVGVKMTILVPQTVHKLVSGVDIYMGNTEAQFPTNDNVDYEFVDNIPMDQEKQIVPLMSMLKSGIGPTTFTVSGKNWVANQWQNCFAKVGDTFYKITLSGTDYVIVAENVTVGTTFSIWSKWYSLSGQWRIVHYLASDDGEKLIDRVGHAIGKSRYCPYANHIEVFKGFVWLADYIDSGGVRRDSRLINNVINFDGLSTVNIYNEEVHSEFKSSIIGLKAFDDYMIILTNDGIYSMRFVPSQNTGAWSWSIKKISDVLVSSHKYITGDGNSSFLFDGELMYASDGHSVKPIVDIEQQVIIAEETTPSGINANDYSLGWNPRTENLYMIADNIVRVKGGIFIHTLPSALASQFIGTYKGNSTFFQDSTFKEIKDISDGEFSGAFDFEMHQTDLGMKEDKYFITGVLHVYKGLVGTVKISIYLNSTYITGYTLSDGTSYDEYFDIVIPKSKSRRFTDIYLKVQCLSSAGVEFRLKTLDAEIEPVRRTRIS